jgi:L-alanine-DL-glutamate epimerase-like enolase superfamily enzyme
MKINKIEIYRVKLTYHTPLRIASGSLTHSKNIIVKIYVDDGIIGVGEASPSIHESDTTVLLALDRIIPALKGLDFTEISKIIQLMDSKVVGSPSAKAAIDIALHDALGKKTNHPVYELLGGFREIQTDITLSLNKPKNMSREALIAIGNGFRILKMKASQNSEKDLERVKAVRKAVGPEIAIRIDANQGWTVSQAINTLNKLEAFNIEFVEQPVKAADIKGLREVRKNSLIPIMADESVSSPEDAQLLIDNDAVDLLNIKLMKCGGIIKGARISSIAQSANIKCMIGCMCESQIGITAGVHVASALSNIQYADLDSDILIKERIAPNSGSELRFSTRIPPSKPGLGIDELDPKILGKALKTYILS